MEVNLHPDMERLVREMADGGEFRDEAEVLTEALFLLWQRTPEAPAGTRGCRHA